MTNDKPRPPAVPYDPFLALPDVTCPEGCTMDEECLAQKKAEFQPQLDAEDARYHRVTDKRRDEMEDEIEALPDDAPLSDKLAIQAAYTAALAELKKAYDSEIARISKNFTDAVESDCCICD